MKQQPTSGSSLSQEIIKYVQVNRQKIDRLRYATIVIRVVDGVILGCDVTESEKRGKEIDYL